MVHVIPAHINIIANYVIQMKINAKHVIMVITQMEVDVLIVKTKTVKIVTQQMEDVLHVLLIIILQMVYAIYVQLKVTVKYVILNQTDVKLVIIVTIQMVKDVIHVYQRIVVIVIVQLEYVKHVKMIIIY